MSTGDRLWSDNGGRVELTLHNGALWLGTATSVVLTNLDDRTAQFELQQGTLDLRVRRLLAGDIIEIDTPNLAFQVTQPGRYRLEVDPQSGTTTVVVRNGTAEVYGERASYVVTSGQGYRFYRTDLSDSESFTPRGVDEFDRFALQRDARFDRVVSARYVSPDVVGYEDLDRYGSWRPVESYGNVWFPREVPSDWAPYRHGHWSWIDPWGWTWVDDLPWGFAPFHYGRWAYVQERWGWVPGPINVRPVYAPALVAFVGGSNFSLSVSSGPAVGWFPLAPREVYRPAYNVSREYYRQVNVSNTVINNTVINNTYVSNVTNNSAPVTQQINYVNLRAPNAVTAVPPAAFAQSQSVARVAVRLPTAALSTAQVQSMAPIAPARTAFIGAAPPSQARPPITVQRQPVVAKSPPPPAPVPVAQQIQAFEKNPGKPLDRAELQSTRAPGQAALPPQNIRVVNPGKPAPSAPPPAVQGDASRARTPLPGSAPVTAVPPPPQAGSVGAPSTAPTPRGPVPAANGRANPSVEPSSALPPAPPRSAETPRQPVPTPTPTAPGAVAPPVPPRGGPLEQPRPVPQVQRPGAAPSEPHAIPQEQPRPVPQGQQAPRPPEPRATPQEPPRLAPPATPPVGRPPEPRVIPQEPPRPASQALPPAGPSPERRAAPQEQPRPAPQAQPAPRPLEPRAIPQEPPRPAPQASPPVGRPPETRPTPQEQPRPVPQAQPAPRPPEPRAIPQEQPRPVPQAQPTPRPPEPRAIPQEQPRPVPAPPIAPRQDDKKDKDKDKDKEKEKEKEKEKDKEKQG